jgi:uroporphyrinogen decarboxylase
METMTPRERVMAVIERKVPDRVPHFEWGVDSPVVKALTKGGTYEDLIEQLNIDAIMTGASYESKKIDDRTIIDEWGITKQQGAMEHRIPDDSKAPIQSPDDLKNWSPPDPYKIGRLDTLKKYIKLFKGKRAIFIYVRDVWSLPRDLMGYMNLMVACKTQPELVTSIIKMGMQHNLAIVEQAAELGADIVFTGDDIADNRSTLISPAMWENLFAPHFKYLITCFHEMGIKHWKHSDGNLMSVMESLIDAGIDGIDPIDPLGGMNLEEIKNKYGHRVAIKGNVDCSSTLVHGTIESVIEEVKACIRVAGPGGGYVCSSSNSIHSGVKPELYKTMVEAIHIYGKYPLDLDKLEQINKK